MGREEFSELVQSSIQDCQVRTSNPCHGLSRGLQACWLKPAPLPILLNSCIPCIPCLLDR